VLCLREREYKSSICLYPWRKIGKKIREAEIAKIPYMLVIGDKEIAEGKVAVRKHGEGDKGTMKTEDFITFINEELKKYFL